MIEKKLKKSAEKIKMPAELKKRILSECENEDVSENSGEQHIFTVEPAKSRTAARIISAAACMAAAAGIVLSGIFIIRNEEQYENVPPEENILIDKIEEGEAPEEDISEDNAEATADKAAEDTEDAESNAPFADTAGNIIFSGFRNIPPYNESTENLLDEEKSQNIRNFLAKLEWEEIDSSEYGTVYYGNVDSVNFYAPDDERHCTLSINMDGSNTAMYSEASIDLGDDMFCIIPSKYYRVDTESILSGMTEYIYDFYDSYPPFGSIYKQTDEIFCSCDKYTGFISDDDLRALSRAFVGWQWDNEEIVDVPLCDENGTPEYASFRMENEFCADKYIVYSDGTVEWQERPWNEALDDYDSEIIHRYYNVDGEDDPIQPTGGLCLMLNRVITENVLGESIVQKTW
ncbi:MAG: hypothetical protein K2J26_07035 [Ruminococcus sp.]|nr:hypothetical protein [Ruminococcus sp.]